MEGINNEDHSFIVKLQIIIIYHFDCLQRQSTFTFQTRFQQELSCLRYIMCNSDDFELDFIKCRVKQDGVVTNRLFYSDSTVKKSDAKKRKAQQKNLLQPPNIPPPPPPPQGPDSDSVSDQSHSRQVGARPQASDTTPEASINCLLQCIVMTTHP